MTLVMDISRLLARANRETPTGIDRFELHYAAWASENTQDQTAFVETTALGPRLLDRAEALHLIDNARNKWTQPSSLNSFSARLKHLANAIDGIAAWPSGMCDKATPLFTPKAWLKRVGSLAGAVAHPPRIPNPTFINVSHARLDKVSAFTWLGQQRRGVFYVHDLIPLSHPRLVRAGEPLRHSRRMQTVLDHGRLVLCNSRETQTAFREEVRRQNVLGPTTEVLAPGVEEAFLLLSDKQRLRTKRSYFVCVGTIEPRKNHALLLNLWRSMAAKGDKRLPGLVIAGRRGWAKPELLSKLDNLGPLQGDVFEVAGLNDSELASLIGGAKAVLAPSFVEGYDMPVLESLAVGTPVIASDIDTHREVAGDLATFIDAHDLRAWAAAIGSHVSQPIRIRKRNQRTWRQHFQELDKLLSVTPEFERSRRTVSKYSLRYSYGC